MTSDFFNDFKKEKEKWNAEGCPSERIPSILSPENILTYGLQSSKELEEQLNIILNENNRSQ